MAERTLPAVRPVERGTVQLVDGADLLPSSEELATIQAIAVLAHKSRFFSGSDTAEKAAMQILAGREYGIGPWQSLAGMHVINGRPTLAADTMAGLIQRYLRRARAGLFRVVESSNERCVVEYRRPEWEQSSFVEWTIQDANRAGLTKKGGTWVQYPRAMLRARAIAEAARAGFPDICAGLYDPDELADAEARPVVPADVRPALPKWRHAAPPREPEEEDDGLDDDGLEPVPDDEEDGADEGPDDDEATEADDQESVPFGDEERRIAGFRDRMEAARSLKELKAIRDELLASDLPDTAHVRGLLDFADARNKAFRLTHER
jgi:RecT family